MADDFDDLLTPDEIEALMQAAKGGGAPKPQPSAPTPAPAAPPASPAPPAPKRPAGGPSDVLSADDIEGLLKEAQQKPAASHRPAASQPPQQQPRNVSSAERLLDEAESQLKRAVSTGSVQPPLPHMAATRQFQLPEFSPAAEKPHPSQPFDALRDVELDLRVELGRTELLIEDVLKLREGTVVPLDKLAGDPVDILVNGRLVARGEVLVLNDNFCVRIAEIVTPDI